MNELELTADELRQVDALVDGALQEPHYSKLLSRLEQVPDGWKICALTFLEHQALDADLKCYTQNSLTDHLAPSLTPTFDTVKESIEAKVHWTRTEVPSRDIRPTTPSVTSQERLQTVSSPMNSAKVRKEPLRANNLLMMAASVAIAFAGGLLASGWLNKGQSNSTTPLDGNATSANSSIVLDEQNREVDEEQALADAIAYRGLDPDKTFAIDSTPTSIPTRETHLTNYDNGFPYPINDMLTEASEKKMVRLNSLVDAEMERVQTFVPYTRADGSEIVVPVQNLKFRPIAVHGF
jgi:hypothetical protein